VSQSLNNANPSSAIARNAAAIASEPTGRPPPEESGVFFLAFEFELAFPLSILLLEETTEEPAVSDDFKKTNIPRSYSFMIPI